MIAKKVPFLTVEDGDDLIVSFPLGENADVSLTLLRTPKFEHLLPEEDRGVIVDAGHIDESEMQHLVSVEWGPTIVKIESTSQDYTLDVEAITNAEIKNAKRVLRKMSFDHSFGLKIV